MIVVRNLSPALFTIAFHAAWRKAANMTAVKTNNCIPPL
jgi:hypothetical protein